MPKSISLYPMVLCLLLAIAPAGAATYYVNVQTGGDGNQGVTSQSPLKTLQKAATLVLAGDTVLVEPGVYFGPVELHTKGTAEKPIIFRATQLGENKVVITNADAENRAGKAPWKCEDEARGLYSVPFAGQMPARVLYSGVDLFPYVDAQHLKTFLTSSEVPGPQHGYALDPTEKKLYVRLHTGGLYGSSNPAEQVMAVAPPTGTQMDGTFITTPSNYNFGVLGAGPGYVILDGFTFETPGVAGVYVQVNNVTVRRCWFRGCHAGVGGNYSDKLIGDPAGEDYFGLLYDPEAVAHSAANITIEYCDYSQFPTFDDAAEILRTPALLAQIRRPYQSYWPRKASGKNAGGLPSNQLKYEIGIAARIGRDWTIRRNYLHDAFEGMSCHATAASSGLQVVENVFERLLDNGVECEDHAQDMHIVRNVFIDNFMPFSWQPLRGTPWPGPIYCIQNVMICTPKYQDMWRETGSERTPFKMGAQPYNWTSNPHMKDVPKKPVTPPAPGLIFANNTVIFPNGRLFMIFSPIENVLFVNNVFTSESLIKRKAKPGEVAPGQFKFQNNIVAPDPAGQTGPGKLAAGEGGIVLTNVAELKLDKDLRPEPDSPLKNRSTPVSQAKVALPDIGAIQPGDTWYPLTTGPLAAESR